MLINFWLKLKNVSNFVTFFSKIKFIFLICDQMEKDFPSKLFISLENEETSETHRELDEDYTQVGQDTMKLHYKYPVNFTIGQNEVVSQTQKFNSDNLLLESGNLIPIYFDEISIRKKSNF